MSTFSPSTCGWWCYGWLTLLLGAGGMAAERAATPAAPAARPASAPAFAPTVRGGFMVPEYDTQNRKKSLLSGQEARARSASVWEIKVLKIETYAEGEKLTWVVEAPDCLFDYQSKSATSASRLQAHSTDGQFAISGTGFEWRQADSSLLISNQGSRSSRWCAAVPTSRPLSGPPPWRFAPSAFASAPANPRPCIPAGSR
jgi:hypothetical protein